MALNNDEKHVMLSYNWDSKVVVSQIYQILIDRGIKTWMDVNGGVGDNIDTRYEYQSNSFPPFNHIIFL